MSRLYYVYVVEMSGGRSRAPRVYVGSSALRPETRFKQHHRGGVSSSGRVRRQGRRLRPDLFVGIGPFKTRESAERAEQRLVRSLERRGFEVTGGCRSRREHGCAVRGARL